MIGAFLIGLFGSLHCIGMCGPIMLSMMGSTKSFSGFLLYQAGRIGSYTLIGLLLGLIGATVSFFNFQQVFAIAMGLVLILMYGIPSLKVKVEHFYYQSILYKKSKRILLHNLSLKRRWLLSGVANGFFPCGLTYVAAAGAVASGGVLEGLGFMLVFGLGTVPALLILSLFNRSILALNQRIFSGSVSTIAMLSGTILFFRGIFLTFPDFGLLVQQHAFSLISSCGL